MKLGLNGVLLFFLFISSNCSKDQVLIPLNNSSLLDMDSQKLLSATSAPLGAYNIVNSLPSGYVKDGSRDYTTYIQSAIDKYSEIAFPGFPILVNETGLKIGSNKRITFLNGSEIRLKPTSSEKYNVLDIRGVTNVTLVDPVIVGDRKSHLGTGGEAGIGIGIRGSSNITISNPKTSNCWGDGILIGVHNGLGSKNIVINNGWASNNRRNGLTVVSVDGLKINKFYSGFNSGTLPQAGVDFEPDSPKEDLKNIVINDLTTEGNASYGIQMVFKNLFGGSNKYVDITFNNHVDKQSVKAIKLSAYNSQRVGSEIVSANVIFNNPSWRQHSLTPKDIVNVAIFEKPQHLTLKNLAVQTSDGSNLSASSVSTLMARLINTNYVTLTTVSSPILSTTSTTTTTTSTTSPTSTTSTGVVYAVNAGGGEVTASNGIKYLADRNFSGGSIGTTTNSIGGTTDDGLYQTERYGNFTYAIPVSDGSYEVTLKLAEVYYSAIGSRKFDVLFEGVEQVSNLDIFAIAGKNNAYDVAKTVNVSDGSLNIQFRTDVNNAKVAAFHVRKK